MELLDASALVYLIELCGKLIEQLDAAFRLLQGFHDLLLLKEKLPRLAFLPRPDANCRLPLKVLRRL